MQRLFSSCIRPRPLTYASPFSVFISARFNSNRSRLAPLHNATIINTAERVSALAISPEDIWSEKSKRVMEEVTRSPPANAYSGRLPFFTFFYVISKYSLQVALSTTRVTWPTHSETLTVFLPETRSVSN